MVKMIKAVRPGLRWGERPRLVASHTAPGHRCPAATATRSTAPTVQACSPLPMHHATHRYRRGGVGRAGGGFRAMCRHAQCQGHRDPLALPSGTPHLPCSHAQPDTCTTLPINAGGAAWAVQGVASAPCVVMLSARATVSRWPYRAVPTVPSLKDRVPTLHLDRLPI